VKPFMHAPPDVDLLRKRLIGTGGSG